MTRMPGEPFCELADRGDPVTAGHADVHEHDIRLDGTAQADRGGTVRRLSDDGHIASRLDEDGEGTPDEGLIVNDDHSYVGHVEESK